MKYRNNQTSMICSNQFFSVWFGLIHYNAAFFGSEGHVALDRNLGPGYDTLLLRMIPVHFPIDSSTHYPAF